MRRGGARDLAAGAAREVAEEQRRLDEARRSQAAARAKEQLATARAQIAHLQQLLADSEAMLACVRQLEANPLHPYAIEPREKSGRVHEATAVLLLSDLHLEETVDPKEVNGLNEYTPEIATARMHRLAVGLAWLLDLARAKGDGAGYQIRDLMIACNGDITTNYLRGEDMQGNALLPMDAVVFAISELVLLVRRVLEWCPWLERVFMPIVPGNHDRLSFLPRTPFRKRVGMSSAPLLAYGLSTELKGEPRFKLELSPSEHHYTTVYGHTIRNMHGDRFNYQGGVGGIFIPARRHIAGLNKSIWADLTLFGHWHTSKQDDLWVSNGSLIGINAYSMAKGLDPEPPAQTFLLLDKERGKRLCTPVQVADTEGWS